MSTTLLRGQLVNGAWVRSLALVGLCATLLHLTCFFRDPTGTIAGTDWQRRRAHTDHVAHVGEARILPRLGLDTWRIPAERLFRRLTPAELAVLPADVKAHTSIFPKDTHFVPGYPPDRPLVMNYAHVPRIYPPGAFLIGAPSAVLYHHGLVSFGGSNRFYIGILALAWFAAVFAWTASWRASPPSLVRQLLTAFAVAYSWYWTMEGFYDICAVALASVGFEASRQGRHGLAAVLCGLSVFIHPRLFMLGPLFFVVFVAAAQAWRTLSARPRAAVLTGAVLFAGGLLYVIIIQQLLSLHSLAQRPNPLRPGGGPWFVVVGYAVTIVTLTVLLFRQRSRVDAAAVLFGGLAFGSQPYLAPWYWLPMLSWAMTPWHWPKSALSPMSKTAATARVLVVAMFYFASICSRFW